MKATVNYKNIKAYLQGHIREWLFYNKIFNRLIPLHVFEQINYRLFVMNKTCYANGECVECGCTTPALQMADKACAGACYPPMMDDTDWFIYKRENFVEFRYLNSDKPREFELTVSHYKKL